jgi:hypothetical protein
MSGTTGTITDADKVDVRRYCGYPAYGAGATGFQGWRFFQAYGLLEYRLNNMSGNEVTVVGGYLATLRQLETGVPGAAANLDTDKAAVWTHNRDEVRDRTALFDDWRRRLCSFIGVPFGPGLSTGAIRLVV